MLKVVQTARHLAAGYLRRQLLPWIRE